MTGHEPWEAVCGRAIDSFHEAPGSQLEADVAAIYETDPARVLAAIKRIAALVKSGSNLESPWAVLRADLRKHQPARHKAAQQAALLNDGGPVDTWMRHTGCQYAGPDHAIAEARSTWPSKLTKADEPRIRELYHQHAPLADQLERDLAARANAYIAATTCPQGHRIPHPARPCPTCTKAAVDEQPADAHPDNIPWPTKEPA